ncbi:Gar1/Naf1 RNA binding region-domain-containing protein [Peziza echinospora]|nr:Gar1/Naf1 RNA binding region-domain-containing protein [Peziza echinospora]
MESRYLRYPIRTLPLQHTFGGLYRQCSQMQTLEPRWKGEEDWQEGQDTSTAPVAPAQPARKSKRPIPDDGMNIAAAMMGFPPTLTAGPHLLGSTAVLEADGTTDTDLYAPDSDDRGSERPRSAPASKRRRVLSREDCGGLLAVAAGLDAAATDGPKAAPEPLRPSASPTSPATSFFAGTATCIPGLFLLDGPTQGNQSPQHHPLLQHRSTATMDPQMPVDAELHKPEAHAADVEMEGAAPPAQAPKPVENDDVVMGETHPAARKEPTPEPQTTEGQRSNSPKDEEKKVATEDSNGPAEPTTAQLPGVPQSPEDKDMLEEAPTKPKTQLKGKAAYDPDFLAAAEANKGNEDAEWQFDSSDAESEAGDEEDESSSDSSDDSDSDSDSDAEDAEFPRLTLEEQARILMAAEGDDDGDNKPGATAGPLRTKHELPEDSIKVVRPDVVLTDDDKIEELGEVQSVMDKLILIKAKTSGEYQVLNEGSIVTLESREIIGTVSDLLGRVQDPLYIVRFNEADEITNAGITTGTKIFYAPAHSTYVFTKALKAQKGSDASNLHDEEVDENEIEFSDDEAEAEYKRKQKMAKKSHLDRGDRGGKAGGSGRGGYKVGNLNSNTVPPPIPETDEPYIPLSRPPNLSELMRNVAHLTQSEEARVGLPVQSRGSDNKGRGGGSRGRDGQGSRGARDGGRGGYGDRRDGGSRGGRGGNAHGRDQPRNVEGQGGQQGAPTYDPSQSYYSTNHQLPPTPQAPQLPLIPQVPSAVPGHYPQVPAVPTPPFRYNYGGYTQQNYPAQTPQQMQPNHQQPYQFSSQSSAQGQQNYNYQNQAQSPQSPVYPTSPLSPAIPNLPQGAHVNPAFFARQAQAQSQGYFNPQVMWGQQQQQQQQYPQQHQQQHSHQQYHHQQQHQNSGQAAQGQFGWPPQQQGGPGGQNDAVMKAVQDQLDILKGLKR